MNDIARFNLPTSLITLLLLICSVSAGATNEKQPLLDKANSVSASKAVAVHTKPGNGKSTINRKPVDINRASKAELMTLTGIGEAEASKIIAGRPYKSKADITTHGVLPGGVYQIIKNQIVVK